MDRSFYTRASPLNQTQFGSTMSTEKRRGRRHKRETRPCSSVLPHYNTVVVVSRGQTVLPRKTVGRSASLGETREDNDQCGRPCEGSTAHEESIPSAAAPAAAPPPGITPVLEHGGGAFDFMARPRGSRGWAEGLPHPQRKSETPEPLAMVLTVA